MATKNRDNLFQRLGKLFRSGAVVKRKIRSFDTRVAMPDPVKSSAVALFQKSVSPMYTAITSNAYNMAERMMRYNDFAEMEQTPEIACVTKDSIINTPSGDYTIEELISLHGDNSDEKFHVYCYDEQQKKLVVGVAHHVRKTKTANVKIVKFDNGDSIKCTPEHLFLTRDGIWVQADNLIAGQSLMPFYRKNGKQKTGYNSIYTINNGWRLEHQVVAENILGRSLKNYPNEVVHHIDLNKCNNDPSNLQIISAKEHNAIHGRIWENFPDAQRQLEIVDKISKANKGKEAHNKCQVGVYSHTPEALNKISAGIIELHKNEEYHKNAVAGIVAYSKSELGKQEIGERVSKQNIQRWENDIEYRKTVSKAFSKNAKKLWTEEGFSEKIHVGQKAWFAQLSDKEKSLMNNRSKENSERVRQLLISTAIAAKTVAEMVTRFEPGWRFRNIQTKRNYLNRAAKRLGFNSLSELHKNYYANHIVISVEDAGIEDVYDLTTDVYHNFACNGVIIHNSALDIYADETCAQDEKGRSLHVYSENTKIKETLEDLFYDTLNVEFNLRPWTRSLVKFGDFCLYNDVHPDQGVINAIPIPINEIERIEGYDKADPTAVKFRWVGLANRELECWEVTHMRLLGNDTFLPYGSSIIEAARRIWRQLILIEDAMLVYRIVRAPERRVFYIDVGNLDNESIPTYMEQQKTQLRSNQVIDKNSGRVDLRYNPMCYFGDDFIYLCDGRRITFEEISNNWVNYKENTQVWSLDKNNNVVPTRLLWAGKTKDSSKFVEVTLDDGQIIKTTPDHKWLLRDGTEVLASDLKEGNSLMPFYSRVSTELTKRHGDYDNFYVDIFHPGSMRWETAHKLVAHSKYGDYSWPEIIHHANHKKYDNCFNNLVKMFQKEHAEHHRILAENYNKSPAGRAKSSETMRKTALRCWSECQKKSWKNPEIRAKRVNKLTHKVDSTFVLFVCKAVAELGNTSREHEIRDYLNNSDEFKDYLRSLNPDFKNGFSDKLSKSSFLKYLRKFNFSNLRDVKDYVASIKAPIDKIIEYCENNSPDCANDIVRKFDITKYDLNRILSKNNKTIEELIKLPRTAKKSVNCCQCTILYSTYAHDNGTAGHGLYFCSRPCYHLWMKGQSRENILNHSIVSVRLLEEEYSAYGVTVENSTHSVAIGGSNAPLLRGKTPAGGVYTKNSVDEDYFISVRGNDTGTKIDTLAGGQNAAAVEDVAYIQKKLFAALKIPRAYLGYDEMLSSKATLAQEDIRFSRSINVIQRTIIAELNKLAIIHLYTHGFEGEDILNFTLRMSNPSTVAQQQKLEIYRAKFEIAGSAPEGLLSRNFLLKNILMLNDDEIAQINEEQKEDAARAASIGAAAEMTGGGGGGGGGPGLGGAPGGESISGEEEPFGAPGGEAGGAGLSAAGGEEGEVAPPSEEEEVPEEEGDEIKKKKPETELLTSSDDPDDEGPKKIVLRRGEQPIKANARVPKHIYDAGRRIHNGPASTHMPDFNKMTKNQPSLKDPFDMRWMDGIADGASLTESKRIDYSMPRPVMSRDALRAIEGIAKRFGRPLVDKKNIASAKMLSEAVEKDELDIDFEGLEDVEEENE